MNIEELKQLFGPEKAGFDDDGTEHFVREGEGVAEGWKLYRTWQDTYFLANPEGDAVIVFWEYEPGAWDNQETGRAIPDWMPKYETAEPLPITTEDDGEIPF